MTLETDRILSDTFAADVREYIEALDDSTCLCDLLPVRPHSKRTIPDALIAWHTFYAGREIRKRQQMTRLLENLVSSRPKGVVYQFDEDRPSNALAMFQAMTNTEFRAAYEADAGHNPETKGLDFLTKAGFFKE